MTGVTHNTTKSKLLRASSGHQGMMPPPHLIAIANTNLFGGQNSAICCLTTLGNEDLSIWAPRCLLSVYLSAWQEDLSHV
jgi:hypothetical protein